MGLINSIIHEHECSMMFTLFCNHDFGVNMSNILPNIFDVVMEVIS